MLSDQASLKGKIAAEVGHRGRCGCFLDGSYGCFQEFALARTGEAVLQAMRANFVQVCWQESKGLFGVY